MKKLIGLLLSLLMVCPALAEEAETTSQTSFQLGSLMLNGLTVTVVGLLGVFLVLLLFFLVIKGMQKLIH